MSEVKVSEEQLLQLKELQAHYDFITKRYGELYFELKALEGAMLELQEVKAATVATLQAEFGSTGTVDLNTGIFVPEAD